MNLGDVIKSHINSFETDLFTSIPATVVRVKEGSLVDCKIAVRYKTASGLVYEEDVLTDITLMFPSTASSSITFPVEVGDEVMLTFSMRDSSEWVRSEDEVSTPYTHRMHNISDAFATPTMMKRGKAPKMEKGSVVITNGSSKVVVKNDGNIEIGSEAEQALILGDKFMEEFNKFVQRFETHEHTGYQGVITPLIIDPAIEYDFENVLSEKVKTV